MNQRIAFCLIYLLFAFAIISVSGSCFAEDGGDYAGYPVKFDGSGVIDMFKGGKDMTISDTSFKITHNTTFNRPGNLNCSKGWFRKNDFVYYVLEKNSRKIASLWYAKDRYMGKGKP